MYCCIRAVSHGVCCHQAELAALRASALDLQHREASVAAQQQAVAAAEAAVTRERQMLARERQQLQVRRCAWPAASSLLSLTSASSHMQTMPVFLPCVFNIAPAVHACACLPKSVQEQEVRLSEARQRLEAQQAEAAGRTANRAGTPQHPPPPPLASEPSDVSLSAPVTLNDKQHRTAAALLASLGQTANRGRERLARLERVLNTIAADAAEPQKVRVDKALTFIELPCSKLPCASVCFLAQWLSVRPAC